MPSAQRSFWSVRQSVYAIRTGLFHVKLRLWQVNGGGAFALLRQSQDRHHAEISPRSRQDDRRSGSLAQEARLCPSPFWWHEEETVYRCRFHRKLQVSTHLIERNWRIGHAVRFFFFFFFVYRVLIRVPGRLFWMNQLLVLILILAVLFGISSWSTKQVHS